jgi:alpha/beta superfamily hydrolase
MSVSVAMNWVKQRAWTLVVGSLVTMIVGFSWGGWTTGSGTDRIAMERSQAAVTAALVPVCLEKSKADPASSKKLGALKALTSSYDQRDAVLNDGWATIGGGEANRDVAELCASQLMKTVAK